jgi:hypothetical protein
MRTLVAALIAVLCLAHEGSADEAVSQTFAAPVDRVWAVTEAVLKQFGWKIAKADRSIGWIETESRVVEGEDYGVYAKGLRHRLRINVRSAGEGRTTVSVERTLFRRERILWVDKDEPVSNTDRAFETKLLTDIGKSL